MLAINLTKYVQALYTENYRTSLKGKIVDLNKWKDTPCLWIERLYIVFMSFLQKVIYRLSVNPVNTPAGSLVIIYIDMLILKFTLNQGARIVKFNKKNKVGEFTLLQDILKLQ